MFSARKEKFSGGLVLVLLIILLTLFANAHGLKAPFQFDDEVDILERPAIRQSPISSAISAPFRAVTYFTFGLDWKIGEGKPLQFHVTNLLLHLVTLLLFFAFVSKLKGEATGAISALWLAVHPLMASCVTYISARAGLLSALFSLVVLTLFFTRPCKGWLALAVVSFLLALFSKEDAVSLPLLLFFISYKRSESSIKSRREILYLASFFGIALIYGAFRVTSHKVVLGEAGGATFFQTFLLSPYVLVKSFVMILLPIGMTTDHYVAPITTFGDVRLWGALLFCLSVLIGALYGIKKNSLIAFPLLWFLIALLPSVLTPLADPFAENRLYFASAGIAMGLGMLIKRVMLDVAGSPRKRLLLISTVLLMTISMLFYNLHRQSVWNSKVRLWGEAVRMAPDKTRPLDNLALAFFDLRDLKKAQFLTKKSLKIDPKNAVAWNTLGLVLKEEKRYNEALSAYEKALSLAPSLPKIRTNMANVLATLGKYDEAIEMYEEALFIDSDADAHFGLGFIYFKTERYDRAKEHILQTLELNPKDIEAQMLLWEIEKIEKR